MAPEKRRRKKARTADVSSDSESESSSSPSSVELSELSELSGSEVSDTEMDVESSKQTAVQTENETPRERLRKLPNADFTQTYMQLVTKEFGDDLAALRTANDFTPASIAQLVAGLRQGVDIFSIEQQRKLANTDV